MAIKWTDLCKPFCKRQPPDLTRPSSGRLCLSPQCGFASCGIGNKLTETQQWVRLALVKEIAEEVWGWPECFWEGYTGECPHSTFVRYALFPK